MNQELLKMAQVVKQQAKEWYLKKMANIYIANIINELKKVKQSQNLL